MAPPPDSARAIPPGGADRLADGSGEARPMPARRQELARPIPGWLIWLPMGICSLLVVLFAVVVNRQQDQAQQLGNLITRVQSLEHSRSLERTSVLEEQLRSMVGQLQTLEQKLEGQEKLSRQLQILEQQVQLLRATSSSLRPDPLDPDLSSNDGGRPSRTRTQVPLIP